MRHSEITDLLGAYALDAVDADERDAVDRHLATCARCRAEVQEHREVASLLAHRGGDAPEGVWQKIASSLEEPPPGLRLVREPAPSARRRLRPLPAVAMAAAVVLVAVLGFQVRQQGERVDELQTALERPNLPAYQVAMQDPSSRPLQLASPDAAIVARGAVLDGVAYVRVTDLPRLAAGRTYQLWGVAGDQLVSLGVLGGSPEIITFPATGYSAFAITEEAVPGVVVSANQPVVAGAVA